MRILRFDSVGGASGDMILAALIDLGVELEGLQAKLKTLPIEDFTITATQTTRSHLRGTVVNVEIPPALHDHHHAHRTFADIRELISSSRLHPKEKKMAIKVFEDLAKAEAKVHNTTPEEVHFHEVGAVDSIVDIVGACIALLELDVDEIRVAPLPLGTGTVDTAHGKLPIPAPATLELLKDLPVEQTDEPHELVTPTGAALLAAWRAERDPSSTAATVRSTGYGFGHRQLKGRANLIRATILETDSSHERQDECLVMECNIDDMTPELLGSLTQRLLASGALDVFTCPINMKKQRPGSLLTVLARPVDKPELLDLIFRESTTFGVREHLTTRTILERTHIAVSTPYGKVRLKVGRWKNEDITAAPEHDDCVSQANKNNVSVRAVYEAALRAKR